MTLVTFLGLVAGATVGLWLALLLFPGALCG